MCERVVGQAHVSSVSKSRIKRLCVGREEVFDICETFNLELLGLLLNHFPGKGNTWNQRLVLNHL